MPTHHTASLGANDPSLIQLGRDLSATLLEGNLDKSLALLLTHAEQTGYCFSEDMQTRLHLSLSGNKS